MTLLSIDNHSGVPIFRQIQDQLRRQLLANQLAPGEQLPPVRDLAVQLRVNPMTVSKAYALLELEGLVERRRGVGLFAARLSPQRRGSDSLSILAEMLTGPVASAVQLGLSDEDAIAVFRRLLGEYRKRRY
jgi:GntR family transcriptional regulator